MTAQAEMAPGPETEWQAFIDRPAAYADPRRLAACFDGAVSQPGCARLLQAKRLQPRLSKILIDHYRLSAGPAPDDNDDDNADRAVALSAVEDLDEIALRAGAIYWGGNFAGIIVSDKTAALYAVLGEELPAIAAANKDLTGPAQPLEPFDSLRERVFADGWRCLGAWCHAVSTDTGTRVRLKLPPDDLVDEPPTAAFVKIGPAIVRRVVTSA